MRQLLEQDLSALTLLEAVTEVTAAMPTLFEVDGAGILVADDHQVLRHFASTDSTAQFLETVQESTGQGPCVQAMIDDVVIATSDVLTDERWPDLGQMLAGNGVRAMLGAPIRLAGAPLGSINVYKSSVHNWDESDQRALAAFNHIVERLLTAAVVAERNEMVASQLQEALQARVAIERAVGVVMVIDNLEAPAAFERIRRAARSGRRPIRDVAADVVRFRKLS